MVIGTDRKHVQELIELWLNDKKKELAEHHMQIQILVEIKVQLEAFIKHAERVGQNEIAEIYRKTLRVIKEILKNKKATGDMFEKVEEDEVYQTIKEYASFVLNGELES